MNFISQARLGYMGLEELQQYFKSLTSFHRSMYSKRNTEKCKIIEHELCYVSRELNWKLKVSKNHKAYIKNLRR